MIQFRYPIIYRNASLPVSVLIMLAVIVHYQFGVVVGIWLWLLVAGMVFFFRDPKRTIPPVPLAVVSPVDGTVTQVERVVDPFLKRTAMRIQLRGDLLGAYTVRSVTEGKVQNQWFGNLPVDSEEGIYAATGIPPYAQWTQSDEGDDVVTTLSPKVFPGGIRCSASSGERIGQGKACTFVPFGADAEVLLAENTRIDVKAGDVVKAGSSILATLVH